MWWKADDPSVNEGVEPPPEERNPFKAMPTVLQQLLGEANKMDCQGNWGESSHKVGATPDKISKQHKNGASQDGDGLPGVLVKGGNAIACIEASGKLISDGMINPCMQECEHDVYGDMYNAIETQRSRLEELACFEREVHKRSALRQSKENGLPREQKEESACLLALAEAHNAPPRILAEHDFHESDSFAMRSNLGRHRTRVQSTPVLPHSILVARSVSRSEFINNDKAMEAYWKEWRNLEAKTVWRWETLVERDDVVNAAKLQPAGEQEVHFGYLFGIMVEKGSEFPEGDPRRYFKYRVVFQGNNVRDQNSVSYTHLTLPTILLV